MKTDSIPQLALYTAALLAFGLSEHLVKMVIGFLLSPFS